MSVSVMALTAPNTLRTPLRKPLNVLVTGAAGSGKTSTIDALFKARDGQICLKTFSASSGMTRYDFGGLVVWECPGLGGDEANEAHNVHVLRQLLGVPCVPARGELTDHLGYEKGDPHASAFPNSRNGTTPKTVATQVGDVDLDLPRDRLGTFEPRLVPKGTRRLNELDEMIIALYAGGMTVRDIEHFLYSTLGTELSHETISKITDEVLDEVLAWQQRPLEAFYPVIYLDAIVVKVRDGQVANRPIYVALAVTVDGNRDILGLWAGDGGEGAKYWQQVLTEIKNRGVTDVLMLVCDGLKGLPESVGNVWPQTIVQTCVVHLIRAANRFVADHDRKRVCAASLRMIS